MMVFLVVISFLYVFLLLFLLYGMKQVPEFFGNNSPPKTTFSIVIPFRNEAENLPGLLQSLKDLNYPAELFEVLLVNDASEDASEELCLSFKQEHPSLQVKLLQNVRSSGSPKKDAIATAVASAKQEFIITTDADCILPKKWLLIYHDFICTKDASAVAGPVTLQKKKEVKNSFLDTFQELDVFSLQSATVGGFGVELSFMCNGANFCYSKKAFLEVNGFKGNSEIASGDDIFLLDKYKKAGFRLGFLKSKEAVVSTFPQKNLKGLISQRIRWAAKTSSYRSTFGKLLGLVVLLMNLSLVLLVVAVALDYLASRTFFLIFLFKFNVDFILIYRSAQFFGRERIMKNYLWCSCIYPFFSSYVALLSIFVGYRWKGRRFKK